MYGSCGTNGLNNNASTYVHTIILIVFQCIVTVFVLCVGGLRSSLGAAVAGKFILYSTSTLFVNIFSS